MLGFLLSCKSVCISQKTSLLKALQCCLAYIPLQIIYTSHSWSTWLFYVTLYYLWDKTFRQTHHVWICRGFLCLWGCWLGLVFIISVILFSPTQFIFFSILIFTTEILAVQSARASYNFIVRNHVLYGHVFSTWLQISSHYITGTWDLN